jgi:DNA modification methylase
MLRINEILHGNAMEILHSLPNESVHCCVTSPPYWGLRDYDDPKQIGMEETPEEFISNLVSIFREVKRILKNDGTIWVNIGDSYASAAGGYTLENNGNTKNQAFISKGTKAAILKHNKVIGDLKPKDLVGIPWMLAFALRSDGWYLR